MIVAIIAVIAVIAVDASRGSTGASANFESTSFGPIVCFLKMGPYVEIENYKQFLNHGISRGGALSRGRESNIPDIIYLSLLSDRDLVGPVSSVVIHLAHLISPQYFTKLSQQQPWPHHQPQNPSLARPPT